MRVRGRYQGGSAAAPPSIARRLVRSRLFAQEGTGSLTGCAALTCERALQHLPGVVPGYSQLEASSAPRSTQSSSLQSVVSACGPIENLRPVFVLR